MKVWKTPGLLVGGLLMLLQWREKVIVGYTEDFLQGDQFADADIVEPTFKLRIGTSADIITAKL